VGIASGAVPAFELGDTDVLAQLAGRWSWPE
jgi:hypothetical protein